MLSKAITNFIHADGIFEIFRYGLIGGLSALSYFSLSNLLNFLMAPSFLSAGSGWLASILVSYWGHATITYKVKVDHKNMGWKFVVLCGVNLLYSTLSTYFIFDYSGKPYVLASAFVTVTVPLIAYPMGKFWVFKEKK